MSFAPCGPVIVVFLYKQTSFMSVAQCYTDKQTNKILLTAL